jgi:hypothetical protein
MVIVGCAPGVAPVQMQPSDQQAEDPDDETPDPDDEGPITEASLTEAEADAVEAAVFGVAALTQATATTQSAADSDTLSSAQTIPALPEIPESTTFGQCPVVTLSLRDFAALVFEVTVDFGASCNPAGTPDHACSGRATGSLSAAASTMEMVFERIACNAAALDGSADLIYALGETNVDLVGDWDLDWMIEDEVFQTVGTGDVTYDRLSSNVFVSTFQGTVAEEDGSWTLQARELDISFVDNASLIPSSGVLTLSGGDIRTVTVTFDENSPSTGQVGVSVDGGPTVTISLDEL